MAYATRLMSATVTYTEAAPITPTGSESEVFTRWVVAGTLAAQQAAFTTQINDQFKNMRSGGRSISIGAITEVATRPYEPRIP
jgi:hypothetical protein